MVYSYVGFVYIEEAKQIITKWREFIRNSTRTRVYVCLAVLTMIKRDPIGAEQNVINHTPLRTGYIRALLSQSCPRNGVTLKPTERRFDKSLVISLFQRYDKSPRKCQFEFFLPFSIIIRRVASWFEKIINFEKK